MKRDRPSRTAQLVAIGRALADAGLSHVPGFRDPTARRFLDEKSTEALLKAEQGIREGRRGFRIEYARTMADMMALRTTAIDTAVRDAIARGASQLVILGAGYDGRAWRLEELAGIAVYEVDHPATQGRKRERASGLPAALGAVHFVPVDFERDSLDAELAKAGHDARLPTCWIWEGVVMYLTPEAFRATLSAIAGRSAPGSTLIVNYHSAGRSWLARLMFRLIGEPMISAWSPEQVAAELHAAGFEVREDTGLKDWNAKWAQGQARADRGAFMRVVVATIPSV
jgi:methyltransferase (TIGR00027 family)